MRGSSSWFASAYLVPLRSRYAKRSLIGSGTAWRMSAEVMVSAKMSTSARSFGGAVGLTLAGRTPPPVARDPRPVGCGLAFFLLVPVALEPEVRLPERSRALVVGRLLVLSRLEVAARGGDELL